MFLLINGFFLSFLLLILLIFLASTNSPAKHKRQKIKEDLKKIKKEINGEEETEEDIS